MKYMFVLFLKLVERRVVMKMIKEFFNDESGATMVEYAILVALIAVAVIAIVTLLGIQLDAKFQEVCTALKGSACAAAAP